MPVSEDNINPHLTEPLRVVVFLFYHVLGAPHIRHHTLPVRRCMGTCNAVFLSVPDVICNFRCLEECLGRHTPCPETVATDAVLLYKRGLFTQFCSRHGKHKPRASAANNRQIIF